MNIFHSPTCTQDAVCKKCLEYIILWSENYGFETGFAVICPHRVGNLESAMRELSEMIQELVVTVL